MNARWLFSFCALTLCAALAAGRRSPDGEALAAGSRVVAVEVHPERIDLGRRFEYAQLLVSGRLESGAVLDLTREVVLAAGSDHLELTDGGLVLALADGEGQLELSAGGHTLRLPYRVRGQGEPFEASFANDVMPVLSRIGCNAGSCHGSAAGRNGFKLSLRGYDPDFDHAALTDDLAGRRFDRVEPDRSLFLLKPTAAIPHEGGALLERDSREYEILREWVAGGAELDRGAPPVVGIEVLPQNPVLPRPELSQQVAVLATYADGSVRDVSREAFVETDDTEILAVGRHGLVTGLRRGEAAILARYEGRYAATRVFVMDAREGYAWNEAPEHNWIDAHVYEKLRRVRALPSELCNDAEFLRRVSLDLTGQQPTARETRVFLMDSRPARVKREELIERLIGSADFVDHWTNKWADLLQVRTEVLGREGAERFRAWIRTAVASNEPYDRFARDILGASGSTHENPPAAYFKVLREPDLAMENTTQLFLGVRFNCNKCHDHPFERWTRDQHWQLAAFFGRVGRANAEGSPILPRRGVNQPGDGPIAAEEIVTDLAEGEVRDPETGEVVAPAFPFEHAGPIPADADRRTRLVAWLTAPENPYFARSFVNRLWSYFLGRGLIEPVDDIRAGNPPTHPELLDRLTQEFVQNRFDVRHVMRTICRSRVYQHSIRTNAWNEDDRVNYAHAYARRLPAEVLYDALHRATGAVPRLSGARAGVRAAELLDSSVEASDGFLGLFGRPPRQSACECERASSMSLGQALNLVNGATVGEALLAPDNSIARLLEIERGPRAIVEELYLSFLCRFPTEAELDALAPGLEPGDAANRAALAPEDEARLTRELAEWEASMPAVAWHVARPGTSTAAGGATLRALDDGSFVVEGPAPERDAYTVIVATDLERISGLRLEVLPDASLAADGPGRAENGNFVLGELRAVAVPLGDPAAARPLVLQNATADFSQGGWPVAHAIDGDPQTGWAVSPRFGRRHEAVFETAADAGVPGGTVLVLTLDQEYGGRHTIGRFRISVTVSPRPVRHHGLPDDVAAALAVAAEDRDSMQESLVYAHFLSTRPDWADRVRLSATQDLAWALVNSPAFLFNR